MRAIASKRSSVECENRSSRHRKRKNREVKSHRRRTPAGEKGVGNAAIPTACCLLKNRKAEPPFPQSAPLLEKAFQCGSLYEADVTGVLQQRAEIKQMLLFLLSTLHRLAGLFGDIILDHKILTAFRTSSRRESDRAHHGRNVERSSAVRALHLLFSERKFNNSAGAGHRARHSRIGTLIECNGDVSQIEQPSQIVWGVAT